MKKLTLTRLQDGLTYHFTAEGTHNGKTAYRREDAPDLWLEWHPDWGWCTFLPDGTTLSGLVWGIPRDLQGDAPPEGIWVSRKEDRSYVYTLTAHT